MNCGFSLIRTSIYDWAVNIHYQTIVILEIELQLSLSALEEVWLSRE